LEGNSRARDLQVTTQIPLQSFAFVPSACQISFLLRQIFLRQKERRRINHHFSSSCTQSNIRKMVKKDKSKFELAPGVNRLGRAHALNRQGKRLHFKKGASKKEKKEEKKAVIRREPRWYAADDVKKPKFSRKSRHHAPKLKAGLTPGAILILLAGRFSGKRVVFLKQLPSGQLLVTGPHKVNGVPLKRVDQAYVIATSTKIDISSVKVDNVNDDLFKKEKKEKKKKGADFFVGDEKKKVEVSPARKEAQKAVDSKLAPIIAKVPQLKQYLGARFTLTKGLHPHKVQW